MRKAWTVLLVSALVALTACGGDSDEASDDDITGGASQTTERQDGGVDTCEPSGSAIAVVALPNARLAFDKACLAVPAGRDFTLTFDNQDNGVPHTVDFRAGRESAQNFYTTGQTTGPNKQTFTVAINKFPGTGTYHFRCTVHPTQMQGTFIIK